MNFLEFFVWGSWLISLGGYMFGQLHATGSQIGATYGTMGIASLFMPALLGIVADRWINAERVLGSCCYYRCLLTHSGIQSGRAKYDVLGYVHICNDVYANYRT